MNEYFNSIAAIVSAAGLDPANYRLQMMVGLSDGDPAYIDYPAQWYFYSLACLTPKEALLTEYPSLSGSL